MYMDFKTCVWIYIFHNFVLFFITMCWNKVLTECFDNNRSDTDRHWFQILITMSYPTKGIIIPYKFLVNKGYESEYFVRSRTKIHIYMTKRNIAINAVI